MKKLIKKIIPVGIKNRISSIKKDIYYNPVLKGLRTYKNNKRIILFGTPEHGNLGDHLIAEAEVKFLQDYFSDYEIIEITGEHYRCQRNTILRLIKNKDIIVITGSGFLGNLWVIEEEMVRDIISLFSKNKIIIFPSTIYFTNNKRGSEEFKKSKSIYNNHKDLAICVRDGNSIEVARDLIGSMNENKIIYTPDIALYLNKTLSSSGRSGILFCLREDKEKVRVDSDINILENFVKKKGIPFKIINTAIPKRVTKEGRVNKLQSLTAEFGETKLVITDRLHGMIFSAITGTPCIAMDNLSGKVRGVYSWINYLGYIKFASSLVEVPKLIDELLNLEGQIYENETLIPAFEKIAKLFRHKENIIDKTKGNDN